MPVGWKEPAVGKDVNTLAEDIWANNERMTGDLANAECSFV